MKHKRTILLIILGLLLVVSLFLGGTYAYWQFQETQENANVIVSKCFDLSFEEEENTQINLLNTFPILDEDGRKLKPYVIHLRNQCNNELTYQMNLELLENTTLNEKYVKVMVNDRIQLLNTFEVTEKNIKESTKAYRLEQGVISGNSMVDLSLRIWLDGAIGADEIEAMNQSFYSKVSVVGSINQYSGRYTESILNGTDPVLKNGLIPVTISEDGKVYKADESKEWYSYENKVWANAVILNDETKNYQNNEEIPESNIESYFVWIPRYRYQIFNDGMYYELSSSVNQNEVQEIKVEFENKDKVASDGVRKGQWLTHPAFTSFDVNGIWVGKFETGYKGSTDTTSAQKNVNEPESVQIKPSVNSWRGIQPVNMYFNSYNYQRELDSHMMKNTEWGAVAYLQHSKYGSMTSVRLNNNSNYVTGYSAVVEPTCGWIGDYQDCNQSGDTEDVTKPWNTDIGYLASTTGNISGIYDMSGGSWEYMMGVMLDKEGRTLSGRNSKSNSGFNGVFGCPTCDGDTSGLTELTTGVSFPSDGKYYDTYAYSEDDKMYHRRILGDAMGEMGPFATATYGTKIRQVNSWYADESWFVDKWNPWVSRGSLYFHGLDVGVFAFAASGGHAGTNDTFRIVLAV